MIATSTPPARPLIAILTLFSVGIGLSCGFTMAAEETAPASDKAAAPSLEPLDLSDFQSLFPGVDSSKYPWRITPRGEKTFAHIPLNIRGIMCLWGKANAKIGLEFPKQISDIPVHRKFETLYVYHAAFFVSPQDQPVYRLTMNYDDGSKSTTTLLYGAHLRDWYQSPNEKVSEMTDPKSKTVWSANQPKTNPKRPTKIRFFITSIPNPKPTLEVKSITLDSAEENSAGCIVAMTTGPADMLKLDAEEELKAPPRYLSRLYTLDRVVRLACSADNKLIVIANGQPTLILQDDGSSKTEAAWKPSVETLNAETGKAGVEFKLTTAEEDKAIATIGAAPHFDVTALAVSPDSALVAVGTSIGQVKLFNAQTGELVRAFDDKKAKGADQKTPENLKSLPRAIGGVASLAFSPDGSLLAVCGSSFEDLPLVQEKADSLRRVVPGPGRLKVWEVESGTLKHDLDGLSQARDVAFSPDGNLVACAGCWESNRKDGVGAILWNPRTGEKIRSVALEGYDSAQAVAFSPDSQLLAIGALRFTDIVALGGGAVALADVASGKTKWLENAPRSAQPVAFTPDGKRIVIFCGGATIGVSAESRIRLLDTESGKTIREIQPGDAPQGGRWHDFAIAAKSHKLVIGGIDSDDSGMVSIWDLDEKPANEK